MITRNPVFNKENYLFLDVGGTIVNIEEPFEEYTKRGIQYVYDFLNVDLDKEIFVKALFEERTKFRAMAHKTAMERSFKEFISCGLLQFGIHVSDEESDELELAYIRSELEITSLFDDTIGFLEKAKMSGKNVIVAANNFSVLHVHKLLTKFGLRDYISDVHISCEFGPRKPHKDFLDRICKSGKIAKSDCVMIGDKPDIDVLSGKRSKIRTCLVDRDRSAGFHYFDSQDCPDIIVRNLSEIKF